MRDDWRGEYPPGSSEGRQSLFQRLRTLPVPVQVTGVITGGIVGIDLIRSVRDILLPLIQAIRSIGGTP